MSAVSKNTIKKYVELVSVAGRVWAEGEIVSFRSLINTKLSDAPDVRDMLMERFNASIDVVPFQLEGTQQLKGVAWLRATQLNAKGLLRNAKTTFITELDLAVMDSFDSFEFVGLVDVSINSSSGYRSYVPIYKCISTNGSWFSYATSAHGNCKVVSRGTCANIATTYLKLASGGA